MQCLFDFLEYFEWQQRLKLIGSHLFPCHTTDNFISIDKGRPISFQPQSTSALLLQALQLKQINYCQSVARDTHMEPHLASMEVIAFLNKHHIFGLDGLKLIDSGTSS